MCHLRFEHFYRCSRQYQEHEHDYIRRGEEYPCANLWYEVNYACTDNMLDCLLEIGSWREASGYHPKQVMNVNLRQIPNQFDVVDHKTDGRSFTY